jgi:hypothetical protein
MSPDPGRASDDGKLTGFGCFRPCDKVSDCIACLLAEDPTGIGAWGSTISPWCRHRVGTLQSFLNIDMCRCLDAEIPCKLHEESY